MSSRRVFNLFVAFDLLFTIFLWLICISFKAPSQEDLYFVDHFYSDTLDYLMMESLFDIIVLSFMRYTILMISYTCFNYQHWTIIAITTIGSNIFLIFKIIHFNFTSYEVPAIPLLLLIPSFILPWVEAWFLDFPWITKHWFHGPLTASDMEGQGGRYERTPLMRAIFSPRSKRSSRFNRDESDVSDVSRKDKKRKGSVIKKKNYYFFPGRDPLSDQYRQAPTDDQRARGEDLPLRFQRISKDGYYTGSKGQRVGSDGTISGSEGSYEGAQDDEFGTGVSKGKRSKLKCWRKSKTVEPKMGEYISDQEKSDEYLRKISEVDEPKSTEMMAMKDSKVDSKKKSKIGFKGSQKTSKDKRGQDKNFGGGSEIDEFGPLGMDSKRGGRMTSAKQKSMGFDPTIDGNLSEVSSEGLQPDDGLTSQSEYDRTKGSKSKRGKLNYMKKSKTVESKMGENISEMKKSDEYLGHISEADELERSGVVAAKDPRMDLKSKDKKDSRTCFKGKQKTSMDKRGFDPTIDGNLSDVSSEGRQPDEIFTSRSEGHERKRTDIITIKEPKGSKSRKRSKLKPGSNELITDRSLSDMERSDEFSAKMSDVDESRSSEIIAKKDSKGDSKSKDQKVTKSRFKGKNETTKEKSEKDKKLGKDSKIKTQKGVTIAPEDQVMGSKDDPASDKVPDGQCPSLFFANRRRGGKFEPVIYGRNVDLESISNIIYDDSVQQSPWKQKTVTIKDQSEVHRETGIHLKKKKSELPRIFDENNPSESMLPEGKPPNVDVLYDRKFPDDMKAKVKDIEKNPKIADEYVLGAPPFQLKRFDFNQEEVMELIKQGQVNVSDAWMLANRDTWQLLKTSGEGDTVFTIPIPKNGKIYKVRGIIDSPPKILFDELINNINDMPIWNPAIEFCQRIQMLDKNTDISYQIAKENSGLMAKRDFVTLRHWSEIDNSYISSVISIIHPNLPPRPEYVRGDERLGCFVCHPTDMSPDTCIFEWIVNTPINGWLPQSIIDGAFATAMFNFMTNIRIHAQNILEQKPDDDLSVDETETSGRQQQPPIKKMKMGDRDLQKGNK